MSDFQEIIKLSEEITKNSDLLINKVVEMSYNAANAGGISPFIFGLTVLEL